MKRLNGLDKVILTNLKMAENDIAAGACCMLGSLVCLALGMQMFVLVPVFLAIGSYFLYKVYKKIFYTSTFGKTALFYQSFPMTAKELVLGKTMAAFIAASIVGTISAILLLLEFSAFAYPWEILEYGFSNEYTVALYIAVSVIAVYLETLWKASAIFMAVTIYCRKKYKAGESQTFRRLAIIGITAAALSLPSEGLETAATALDVKTSIIYPMIQVVLNILLFYITMKYNIRMHEKGMDLR